MSSTYCMEGMGSTGSSIVTAAGGAIASASPLAGPAAPIVAAVGGLVAAAGAIAGALHIGQGCGATCIQATSIVNSAEPAFRLNLEGYENGTIDQTTALNNFNQMWTAIQQSCGQIPGTAGEKCVSDRQAGACTWKQTANPEYPGQPNIGACWNWWNAYHDPLEQPSLVPTSGGTVVSGLTSNPTLLIGAGLLVVALMFGGGK